LKMQLWLVVVCLLGVVADAAGKGGWAKGTKGGAKSGPEKVKKSMVAVPRSKTTKGTGGVPGTGLMRRVFRETKTFFCSELEGLTLSLTRPVDAAMPGQALDVLINCMDMEFENPQFTVSLLAKFSRKLAEDNVYTKLKALMSIHRLMQYCDSGAKAAVAKCMRSLRKEYDAKTDLNFFAEECVEEAPTTAATVAELEASDLLLAYADYVYDYVTLRGGVGAKRDSDEAKASKFLKLIATSHAVEDRCKATSGKCSKECLGAILDDRQWMTKQLEKLQLDKLRRDADSVAASVEELEGDEEQQEREAGDKEGHEDFTVEEEEEEDDDWQEQVHQSVGHMDGEEFDEYVEQRGGEGEGYMSGDEVGAEEEEKEEEMVVDWEEEEEEEAMPEAVPLRKPAKKKQKGDGKKSSGSGSKAHKGSKSKRK